MLKHFKNRVQVLADKKDARPDVEKAMKEAG